MLVRVDGQLKDGVTAKDIILASSARSHRRRHRSVIDMRARHPLAVDGGRMTICNMSIEGGARAGLISPDEKTYASQGQAEGAQGHGLGHGAKVWETLFTEEGAHFDRTVVLDANPAADRLLGHVA